MAQEYVLLKNKDENNGLIALSKSVFESIARISVAEVDGCEPIDNEKKAVLSKINNNKLHIFIDAKVRYGVNANQTSEQIQNRVFQNINLMTGLKCHNIDVRITGFVF